jgi:hypothetical protein
LRARAELAGPNPELRRRLAVRYLGHEVARSYLERTAALDSEDVQVTLQIYGRFSWDYSKGL